MLYSDSVYAQCHGCGLCTVVCPAWQQRRDVRVTPHGHAKALQYGGEIQAHALFNCVLCGACSSICPEELDLMSMLLDLRKTIKKKPAQNKIGRKIQQAFDIENIDYQQSAELTQANLRNTVILTDPELRKNEDRVARIMQQLSNKYDISVATDDGHDISTALEAGINIPAERLDRFLRPIRFCEKLIVSDGLLQIRLRFWLPHTEINSLGYELCQLPQIRDNIYATDFYVIESRAYHTDFNKNVSHYDKLRREKHCELNLDLNRLAIPTGGTSDKIFRTPACFSTTVQANWMLSGKKFSRIVVEDLKDFAVLSHAVNHPVVHIAELL